MQIGHGIYTEEVPDISFTENDTPEAETILYTKLQVYLTTDKFQIAPLKSLAMEGILSWAHKSWPFSSLSGTL